MKAHALHYSVICTNPYFSFLLLLFAWGIGLRQQPRPSRIFVGQHWWQVVGHSSRRCFQAAK